MPRYLAELYLPMAGPGDLEKAAARACTAAEEMSRGGCTVRCLRSIFVPADQTCLLLFDAGSTTSVHRVTERARLQVTRVVEAIEPASPR